MNKKSISTYLKNKINYDEKCVDFNKIILLEDEEFRDLKSIIYPEIKPYYKISNKNRIYSMESKQFLSVKIKKSSNNYYQVNLQTEYDGCPYSISKSYAMHRLMMSVFYPVENMDKLYINHKDGNKMNNDLTNLEWCNASENIHHAIDNGLMKIKCGDECSYSTVNEKTVRKICELYLTGMYTKQELANLFNVNKSLICDITNNSSWRHITKEYNLKQRDFFRKPNKFTINDIHVFCKYFQDNQRKETESLRHYLINMILKLKFIENEDKIDENLLYSLRYLYLRKSYKKINSLYNY